MIKPLRPFAFLAALSFLLAAAGVPPVFSHPEDDEGGASAASLPTVARPAASPAASDEGAKKKDKWDVNNPPGPTTEVPIDVKEGTWMDIDVSPDGREIVLDLLGDLYTIPIAGGEAKSLTHDIAWQEQPRYSPDGKAIAFVSDQGGGDNIWLMDRDGKNLRQVTEESYRLVNSPAWTPDGQFLVVRKHFTGRRSAGAGEMWLYHRSGGDGLQMTKKANDQKDAGEPAFSPDGRYLYYSRDVTPGAVFEYSKDVNGTIYAIERLDRETGEIERFVDGPGGSIRPTPSPDGKSLAFIRRVRGKSVIFLEDLRSGEQWPLYDGLDRDLQETWAVHGVYPQMAWTPDGRALVFWAAGKIWRFDLATRQAAEIPFHVKTTRKIVQALRFPVPVARDATFDVKMLRWVEVSPKGDKVVYQALGSLWIRDLPNGTPKRLTSGTDRVELYPSFSRDGEWVAFATWNDRTLGGVSVIGVDGSAEHQLTVEPGHYVEPAVSPDGKWVVFRKVAGGDLRTPTWSQELGLYRISMDGGKAERILNHGVRPHFGAKSDKVYFQTNDGDGGDTGLSVVGIDGKEEHQILSSKKATEMRVSPDGRWVAFRELWNAYVAPFVPTGQTAEIGPKAKSVPVTRVSRDAGEFLRWSGDSRRLYWSLGPELYSRDLPDAFAFLEGAPKKLPEPPTQGVSLGFKATADVPTGQVAIVGGRVVTMRGSHADEVIEDGVVLIEGNRIKALGKKGEVAVPPGAYVVEAAGKTVLPGLIDVHWHGSFGEDGFIPQQSWRSAASLAFGVTTLHDPSNDTDTVFAASELGKAGMTLAPRIFSTGTILYGADAPYTVEINSLDDARSHLRRLKAAGAWSVKSYNQPRREQRQQVLAAARELNMMVVPEGGSLYPYNMTMVVDGHTGVEHSLPIAKIYEDVKELWSASQVGFTPTLGVAYGGIFGENYWYDKTNVWEDQRLMSFVPREVIDPRSRRRTKAPDEEYNHINAAKVAKELFDRGVQIHLGAHGQREGLAAHWEMWMMAQGGMKPLEILRAATLDGAKYLGLDGDIGSLAPGKLADVIVLDQNPLENIRNTESVHWVIANGRVYDAATLDQLAPLAKKREPYYWQREKPVFSKLGQD